MEKIVEIEKETRNPETRLAYGPVVTKDKAKKLGIHWASAVANSLAGQEYKPSLFEEMWYPEEDEAQDESKLSLISLYQKLLDIFCKLFVNEE
jgi:hypothetical protein